MALSDTLAEIDALTEEQANQPPVVPPPGSPGRPAAFSAPPAQPAQAAPPKKSFLQKAGDLLTSKSTYEALPPSILRAPGQLLGGNLDSLADVDNFLNDNIVGRLVRNALPATSLARVLPAGASATRNLLNHGASLADTLSARSTLGQVGNPTVNQYATQAVAIGAGMLGGAGEAQALTTGAKAVRLLQNSARMGVLTGTTADVTGKKDALADRAKEAAVGAAANVVLEPVIGAVSSYIASKLPKRVVPATATEAATDKLDRAFASARTSEARYQAQEAQAKGDGGGTGQTNEASGHEPAAELNQGTRHTDNPGGDPSGSPAVDGVRSPDGSKGRQGSGGGSDPGPGGSSPDLATSVVYQDANKALEASGAAERVDPASHPLSPDGTIPVEPSTKVAADEAGLGRAFASREDPPVKDPVIFKEVDETGGSRVVGMIDKESLQGFKDDVDATRFDGETSLNTDASHPVGQWKLDNLGAPYDVPPFLRALAEQLPEREVLTDAELMKHAQTMADSIGWDPEDMIAYAAHVAGDAKSLPQAMATIRTVYARAASQVDSLLDEGPGDWSALADDDASLVDVLKAVHNIITLSQSLAEFKSAAGQTLRVAGLPDADAFLEGFFNPAHDRPPTNPMDGLPKLPRDKQELQQWLDAWRYTKGDPGLREAFLKGLTYMPGKWMALRTSFANFFTAAIISGPATVLRNFVGPAIVSGVRTVERTAGGYAAALMPWVDPATKQQLLRSASQAPAAYIQAITGAQDALKASLKAFQEGGQVIQSHGIYDLRTKTIPDGLIEAATGNPPGLLNLQSYPYMLANVVNVFPQWIHRIHGGANEFAQRLAYLGEVRAAAMLEASEQGLGGREATDYIKQRLTSSTDEVTWAATDKAALASSQRTTFIKPVGGDTQPIVSRVADLVNTLRSSMPESRYILPIFSVPANAMGEAIRRVPVVGQLFKETRMELAGEMGAAAQAEAYGRVLTGAAFMLGGFSMARMGMITGAGPTQPKDRQIWEAQGRQPYSIRIGDHWVSYQRLDLVGSLLAIPGTIFDKSVHTQLDNQSATWAGVAALAQYFKDQASVQGMSDLLSFGGSPEEAQGYLTRLANQTVSGFVPAFITQLGRNNLDPYKRIATNPWEAILNKLPGASQTLDPQRNPLGEPTYKVQNAGFNLLPISITKANTYEKDPVLDELDRLYNVTGYAPGMKSPSLAKIDMRDVKLEDKSSLYDALMRYRGLVTNDDGATLRQALTALFDSPEYADAVDGDASNLTTANGDLDRGAMVAKIFHTFDALAQHEVANESDTATRYLAIGAAKQANDAFLRDTPTHDLAQNPALLESLGINLQDYEDKVRGQ